jgi:hypothetical protein
MVAQWIRQCCLEMFVVKNHDNPKYKNIILTNNVHNHTGICVTAAFAYMFADESRSEVDHYRWKFG